MSTRSMFTIFIGLAIIPVQASAVCPTNIAYASGPGFEDHIESTAPIWDDRVGGGHFSLNLIAGTAQMIAAGGGGEYSGGAGLQATDLYQIVGSGTNPIPFEVRVHLTGSVTAQERSYPLIGLVCDGANVRFVLTSDAATTEFSIENGFQPCSGRTFVTDLVLPLAKPPGASFPVQYILQSSTSGGVGTIRGEVSFANLPAGYTIVSCQGYVGQAVATVPTSWGRLKLVYR